MNRRTFLVGMGALGSPPAVSATSIPSCPRPLFNVAEISRGVDRITVVTFVEVARLAEARAIVSQLIFYANAATFLGFHRGEVMLAGMEIERAWTAVQNGSRQLRLSFELAIACGWMGFLHDHPKFRFERRDYDRLGLGKIPDGFG